jgi:hypothetical protein
MGGEFRCHKSHLQREGDYMAVFDLSNQFFHIKLATEVRDWFGFVVPQSGGGFR